MARRPIGTSNATSVNDITKVYTLRDGQRNRLTSTAFI